MPLFQESWVSSALASADEAIRAGDELRLVHALRTLPLDLYAMMFYQRPEAFPALNAWLPTQPSDEDQRAWAGNDGFYLLQQAAAFTRNMFDVYRMEAPRDLDRVKVLDYGCGWGRLMRLLPRYVPVANIYGVDVWQASLSLCDQNHVAGKRRLIDYVPSTLPFQDTFDLVLLFSVFTHVSERSQQAILKTIRKQIAPNGLLALTIRQDNFWQTFPLPPGASREELIRRHFERGFAHIEQHAGHVEYGETSMTIDYIRREWTEWRIVDIGWNVIDEFQLPVFLAPA